MHDSIGIEYTLLSYNATCGELRSHKKSYTDESESANMANMCWEMYFHYLHTYRTQTTYCKSTGIQKQPWFWGKNHLDNLIKVTVVAKSDVKHRTIDIIALYSRIWLKMH